MKNHTFLILLFHLALISASCGSLMPKDPVNTIFQEPLQEDAKMAIEQYPANAIIEAIVDRDKESQHIATPFYSSCEGKIVEYARTAGITETNIGSVFIPERRCKKVRGVYSAGFVLVLTQNEENESVWVSVPCILFSTTTSGRIRIAKEYITLSEHGEGSYIFVQK